MSSQPSHFYDAGPSGAIALRWDESYIINPADFSLNHYWDKDIDIVIFSACEELSLCDDDDDYRNHTGFDPRCNVQYGSTIGYSMDHSPTNANCRQCAQLGQASNYGGQKWRALTHIQDGHTVGPKLYLGYHNGINYLPDEEPSGREKRTLELLFQGLGDFDQNFNYEDWKEKWLTANILDYDTADQGQPAAAIIATDPANMSYHAVWWNYTNKIWNYGKVYSTLANP